MSKSTYGIEILDKLKVILQVTSHVIVNCQFQGIDFKNRFSIIDVYRIQHSADFS